VAEAEVVVVLLVAEVLEEAEAVAAVQIKKAEKEKDVLQEDAVNQNIIYNTIYNV
jgi:hypothetical protein